MEFSPDFVRDLRSAENHFLQALVSRFSLARSGKGIGLSLQIDDATPTISTRQAKGHVRERIPNLGRKSAEIQKRLNAVLIEGRESSYRFDDPEFVFRYGNGGVLPIVRMGAEEYFCLFYRDYAPVGWNIANGGADSRAELLYPMTTVEREFREELMILQPPSGGSRAGRRYVFDWETSQASDRAEFALARKVWEASFPEWRVEEFEPLKLPVQWLGGPDSVTVKMGDLNPVRTSGCFLNINAEDFGIEIDLVAKIWIPEDAILLDGEILDDKVLDRPVGLFRVDSALRQLRERKEEFLPDFFFFNGQKYEGKEFRRTIEKLLIPSLPQVRTREEIADFTGVDKKFKLCPVTRSILRRYADFLDSERAAAPAARTRASRAAPGRFDVFISFGDTDEPLARKVFDYLRGRKKRTPFFYKEYLVSRWDRLLDDALDTASALVVVGSNVDVVRKGWPEHEWVAFLNAMKIGRKPPDAMFIPFVKGIEPRTAPFLWLPYQFVYANDIDQGLNKLGEMLDRR